MRTLGHQEQITIGDKYSPAMEIREQAEADEYFAQLVAHSMSFGVTRQEAERVERVNLGYFAGYYDHETRLRVERLFACEHPVFGDARKGPPTEAEAFTAGVLLAKAGVTEDVRRSGWAHGLTLDSTLKQIAGAYGITADDSDLEDELLGLLLRKLDGLEYEGSKLDARVRAALGKPGGR
jgi:hypothetical protein